jgi:hypothetical protein
VPLVHTYAELRSTFLISIRLRRSCCWPIDRKLVNFPFPRASCRHSGKKGHKNTFYFWSQKSPPTRVLCESKKMTKVYCVQNISFSVSMYVNAKRKILTCKFLPRGIFCCHWCWFNPTIDTKGDTKQPDVAFCFMWGATPKNRLGWVAPTPQVLSPLFLKL